LYRNRSVERIKVIRLLSIFHNGIILDLVCGSRWVGSVVSMRMFVLISLGEVRNLSHFYGERAVVRSGDLA